MINLLNLRIIILPDGGVTLIHFPLLFSITITISITIPYHYLPYLTITSFTILIIIPFILTLSLPSFPSFTFLVILPFIYLPRHSSLHLPSSSFFPSFTFLIILPFIYLPPHSSLHLPSSSFFPSFTILLILPSGRMNLPSSPETSLVLPGTTGTATPRA